MIVSDYRKPDHPIESLFYERWSCRSYTSEEISDPQLFSLFEAARWAPSSSNSQPWRFLYSKRGDANWQTYVSLLVEGNRVWASKAAALIFVLSIETMDWQGKVSPAFNHSFDAGAAWAQLALQAHLNGWSTHAMGGIDRDGVVKTLAVPPGFTVEAGIAVGRPGPVEALPEPLQVREIPNSRRPITQSIASGKFAW